MYKVFMKLHEVDISIFTQNLTSITWKIIQILLTTVSMFLSLGEVRKEPTHAGILGTQDFIPETIKSHQKAFSRGVTYLNLHFNMILQQLDKMEVVRRQTCMADTSQIAVTVVPMWGGATWTLENSVEMDISEWV